MAYNAVITGFLSQGTAASRPAAPTEATNTLTFYYATDTTILSFYDWNAAAWVTVAGGATGINAVVMPQGRLTLTTATPVLTSDVTAATTIYYALFRGAYCPIWNGSLTTMTVFTELSQATTDATKSPAACTSNSNYDLFVWSDGGTMRCTRGATWSSDTARGSGAGTTQISFNTDGYYTNTVAITNGPAAGRGTYVGTIRTNGSSQVDVIFGSTGAAGGESTFLGVWNAYNRVKFPLTNYDNTDSWNYTTATMRIKNNNNANKISFVCGLQEDSIHATNSMFSLNATGNIPRYNPIGIDSTTAFSAYSSSLGDSLSSNNWAHQIAVLNAPPQLGFHYLAPLEYSNASGTCTWYGDNGTPTLTKSIFSALIWG